MVEDPCEATHLVMTRIGRSCKFLRALCVVDYVLHSNWLVESCKAGKLLPPDNFKVRDKELEETFDFSMDKLFQSPNRRFLFSGKTFFITPSVFPARSELTKLIELAGGKVEQKRRTAAAIAEAITQSPDAYIIVSCSHDLHLLSDLTRPGKPKCLVCSTEVVMTSIMKQKIETEPHIIQLCNNNNNNSNNLNRKS